MSGVLPEPAGLLTLVFWANKDATDSTSPFLHAAYNGGSSIFFSLPFPSKKEENENGAGLCEWAIPAQFHCSYRVLTEKKDWGLNLKLYAKLFLCMVE